MVYRWLSIPESIADSDRANDRANDRSICLRTLSGLYKKGWSVSDRNCKLIPSKKCRESLLGPVRLSQHECSASHVESCNRNISSK